MNGAAAVWFPPGADVVLLPRDDRYCAALGLTLYTASSNAVLVGQWSAWLWIKTLGPRLLPGRSDVIDIPETAEIAAQLGYGSHGLFSVASFRRRDPRSGLTYVARGRSKSMLIKIRDAGQSLALEQDLLRAVQELRPRTFDAPRPISVGRLADGRSWSAQEMVFRAPHRACRRLPPGFEEELATVLATHPQLRSNDHLDWLPAHGDLSPWNLRIDHRGKLWLYDWEDAGTAPAGADRAYFEAALGVLGRRRMRAVNPDGAAYWAEKVRQRLADDHPSENRIVLERLTSASKGTTSARQT